MPYIMNCLDKTVTTQAHGKHFSWSPGQIKLIHNANLALFLSQYRGEEGLVDVPDFVMELDKFSIEYKEAIDTKKREGIEKRVQKLESIKRNLVNSLRYDHKVKGMDIDVYELASKGELEAMKELASLKAYIKQKDINTADAIRKVLGEIDGPSNSTDIGTVDTRSADTVKPAQSRK